MPKSNQRYFPRNAVPNIIILVLSMFKVSLLASSQLITEHRFEVKTVVSSSAYLALNNEVVSSAYIIVLQFTAPGKQFTKMMNNNGPNIEPWGTPILMGLGSDRSALILTTWVLLLKYDLNHDSSFPLIPYLHNLSINISWLTVSNAFLNQER